MSKHLSANRYIGRNLQCLQSYWIWLISVGAVSTSDSGVQVHGLFGHRKIMWHTAKGWWIRCNPNKYDARCSATPSHNLTPSVFRLVFLFPLSSQMSPMLLWRLSTEPLISTNGQLMISYPYMYSCTVCIMFGIKWAYRRLISSIIGHSKPYHQSLWSIVKESTKT